MSQPNKICPRCQTPAPLSAGFCGSCGHRYRTAFSEPASAWGSLRVALIFLVPLTAAFMFWLVLTLGRPKSPSATPLEREPQAVRAPEPLEIKPAPKPKPQETTSDDPVMREAQRALKSANREIEERASRLQGGTSQREPIILPP
jgi:hypothetical protein